MTDMWSFINACVKQETWLDRLLNDEFKVEGNGGIYDQEPHQKEEE